MTERGAGAVRCNDLLGRSHHPRDAKYLFLSHYDNLQERRLCSGCCMFLPVMRILIRVTSWIQYVTTLIDVLEVKK